MSQNKKDLQVAKFEQIIKDFLDESGNATNKAHGELHALIENTQDELLKDFFEGAFSLMCIHTCRDQLIRFKDLANKYLRIEVNR